MRCFGKLHAPFFAYCPLVELPSFLTARWRLYCHLPFEKPPGSVNLLKGAPLVSCFSSQTRQDFCIFSRVQIYFAGNIYRQFELDLGLKLTRVIQASALGRSARARACFLSKSKAGPLPPGGGDNKEDKQVGLVREPVGWYVWCGHSADQPKEGNRLCWHGPH